ncbi:MAG: glutamate--tRNA ligase [Bacillota bacterium]
MTHVRVRFAPSPTGYLHVGGARTALFNWLFARHHGGQFILRIEDTDRARLKEEAIDNFLNSFTWLGIDWDEGPGKDGPYGPYHQSERIDLYQTATKKLLASGHAYYCFCTAEELEERREQARREGRPPRYDSRCRDLSAAEQEQLRAKGRQPVVRIKAPEEGVTVVNDLIKGDVSFDNSTLDDFVIMKSDGFPTYNFACVVDDSEMQISHVIRADEHLSNTPKQIILYQALGLDLPQFAHVPMILAPDRTKLSKRHGATNVEEYRDKGFLPEALVNYLVLLGWSPSEEREFFTLDELVREFDLGRVSKTAAVYDNEKMTWMNGHYLRELPLETIVERAIPFLEQAGTVSRADLDDRERLTRVISAIRERVKTLAEIPDAVDYFYNEVTEYDEKGAKKHFAKEGVVELLETARERLAGLTEFTLENTEEAYRQLIEERGLSGGALIHPTRLALTGRTWGPGLFEVMILLGKEQCLQRLAAAVHHIKGN